MGHVVDDLFEVIKARRIDAPPNSYTAQLYAKGENEILKKLGEEVVEVIVAAKGEGNDRLVYELADLVYHSLVLLAARDLAWADVETELARRAGAPRAA